MSRRVKRAPIVRAEVLAEQARAWAVALFGDTPGQQWERRRVLADAGPDQSARRSGLRGQRDRGQ